MSDKFFHIYKNKGLNNQPFIHTLDQTNNTLKRRNLIHIRLNLH